MQQENLSLEDLADRHHGAEASVGTQGLGSKNKLNRFVDGINEVFGRTVEYWSQFILSERFGHYLSHRLKYYDFDEMREQYHKKPVLNTKLIKRQFKRKGWLGAYEAFWSTLNRPARRVIRPVYERLGGNEHPVRATMGAFTFSGFVMHALHPFMMPVYANYAASGNADNIPPSVVFITAFYVAAGIPVVYSKWMNQTKASK